MSKSFLDRSFLSANDKFIAGIDEVGRGPLAGPVVSATVLLDLSQENNLMEVSRILNKLGVNDSKKISELKRKKILNFLGIENLKLNEVYQMRLFGNLFFSLSSATHLEIDCINILQASLLSMRRSFLNIYQTQKKNCSGIILVDGKFIFETPDKVFAKAIVKGDQKSILIAFASLIAKDYRDNLMKKQNLKYPGFGFDENAGYPTKIHLAALKKLGPSKIHRKSFRPVKEYDEKN